MIKKGAYYSDNLELAVSFDAACLPLKDFVLNLDKAEEKDNYNDAIFFDHVQDPLSEVEKITDSIFSNIKRHCHLSYHNLTHTKNVIKKTRMIAESAVKLGKLEKQYVLAFVLAALFHDYEHMGKTVRQTSDYNMSNEEFAVMQLKPYDSIRPKAMKIIVDLILSTAFGQGHIDNDTGRFYEAKTDLQMMLAGPDVFGFTHKTGYEHSPFMGFQVEAFNVLEEFPAPRAVKAFPTFDDWIGHNLSGQLWFLKTIVKPRIEHLEKAGVLTKELSSRINSDYNLTYESVRALNSDSVERSDLEGQFYSLMRDKKRELSIHVAVGQNFEF